ncbi:MAG: Ni/Fe-hydrogenase, b-type cytochrome subunit [Bryobacteraceae bacterium]
MAAGNPPLALRPGDQTFGQRYVWELPVRVTHWILAASIVTLFATGLFIASPVFTASGEPVGVFVMGRFRQVHFAAGYALLFAVLLRIYWYFAGNRYARSGMPRVWRKQWWNQAYGQVREYLSAKRGPTHLGHNVLAGFSYVVMVGGLGIAEIVTGFALYGETNPGGFWDRACGWVVPLLGGSFQTHMWHHLFAWGFVAFTIVHLYLVFFGSLRYQNGLVGSMISGEKFFREGDHDE